MEKNFFCPEPQATEKLGLLLGGLLKTGDFIRLEGELGAGKTAFAQAVAQGAGVAPGTAISPTFNIMNVYAGRVPVRHFDLFRLESAGELDFIGFGHYSGEEGINIVEWGGRFPEAMPEEGLVVKITVCQDGRRFSFLPAGARYEELCREVERAYIGH
ncbi:MAG: tRNA (adenosine(37)-N6)-threonylcarbamoyltransferase complex ATPase subunit type 1 TsaE [Acidaminococcales bacterium]|jgi:tRNA threonylcarbamoyladenosine biosynthesis protein TsaE|nr:tRNA (adenosine(37)-N6)-threonylcarbamoyltransferase complex ATPase subunit type 1 TsaE [Acidaminococcales bacterium]